MLLDQNSQHATAHDLIQALLWYLISDIQTFLLPNQTSRLLISDGRRSTCNGRWQLYDKRGPFADRLWPTGSMTGPKLVADQNECDYNISFVPMVGDGLWWSATILVVGGRQTVVPSVWLGLNTGKYLQCMLYTVKAQMFAAVKWCSVEAEWFYCLVILQCWLPKKLDPIFRIP